MEKRFRVSAIRLVGVALTYGCIAVSLPGFTFRESLTPQALPEAAQFQLDLADLFLARKAAIKPKLIPIPDDLFSTTTIKGGTLYCGTVNGSIRSGTLSGEQLLLFAEKVRVIKAKIKRATGAAKRKLQTQLKSTKATAQLNDARCVAQKLGLPLPTPTPKPGGGNGGSGSTPTPAPTPTPDDNSSGCFSGGGNTKAGCFGIPSNLTGNVSQGAALWNNGGSSPYFSSCKGCHGSDGAKYGRSFNQLKYAFNTPAFGMGINPSDSQIAHLTAYLNRFSP